MDSSAYYGGGTSGADSVWGNSGGWMSSWLTQFMGLSSLFGTLFSSDSYAFGSVKLLILGSVIETGRRLCQWFIERFRFQYSMTAQFNGGDPAYEWIVLFLTQEKVWRRSRDFRVSATSSKRKWGVRPGMDETIRGNADYVPTYEMPQLFRWKGYWIEIKRAQTTHGQQHYGGYATSTIFITIYSLDMSVLSRLVEEARLRYIEVSRAHVTIHMADVPDYGPDFAWNVVKHKVRRPLSSIILQDGVIQSLLQDAQEFLDTEDWYVEAGIPHRRGYLLYGPPGTGKSSTIHAIAGELGLEIYSLSLSSGFVDDSFLQRAISSIPKQSILLIEDIDCAFSSREEGDEAHNPPMAPEYSAMVTPYGPRRKSAVTLSGLLNVIDGVGSEEGKLFFATTNYIDRLDPAILRPGRIDKKIEYSLATQKQASALFSRFFPESRFGHLKPASPVASDATSTDSDASPTEKEPAMSVPIIHELANTFASHVPTGGFSTAELQGYLLSCKTSPEQAVSGIEAWVEQERQDIKDREERESERKQKAKMAKEKRSNEASTAGAPMQTNYSTIQEETQMSGGGFGMPSMMKVYADAIVDQDAIPQSMGRVMMHPLGMPLMTTVPYTSSSSGMSVAGDPHVASGRSGPSLESSSGSMANMPNIIGPQTLHDTNCESNGSGDGDMTLSSGLPSPAFTDSSELVGLSVLAGISNH